MEKSNEKKSNHSKRYDIGFSNLSKIDGNAGEKVINSLNDISPDLGKYIIEYAFEDVYSRQDLDIKSKEIAVVACLTAMGNAKLQLKVHINAALNTGCSIAEVHEVILQMSAYSGFPSAINAMVAFKEVLTERREEGMFDEEGSIESAEIPDNKSRFEVGSEQLRKLKSDQVEVLEETFADISSDLAKYVVEYGFADISSRPALNLRYREIATIAALTSLGTASSQLKFHIMAGMNIGITKDEIAEIMILMSVYSGFPSAINGTMVLKEVLKNKS